MLAENLPNVFENSTLTNLFCYLIFQTFTGTLSGAGFGRRVIDMLPDVFHHDFHLSSAYHTVVVSKQFVFNIWPPYFLYFRMKSCKKSAEFIIKFVKCGI